MPPITFQLDETQYEYWRDEICATGFGASALGVRPGRFGHTISVAETPHGQLYSAQNHGDAYSLDRTRKTIEAAGQPSRWGLGVGIAGRQINTFRGKDLVMERGDLLLLHGDSPMVATTHAGAHFGMVLIPDRIAAVLCSTSQSWPETKLQSRTGLGRVLSDYLLSMFDQLPMLGAPDLQSLVPSIFPLLDASVAPTRHAIDGARGTLRALQRQRILSYIDAHLADTRLGPSSIASAFRISTRYVHALFAEAQQSVGETILVRRLDRCRDALADHRFAHLSVKEIAFCWGFNDASHFSRVFRRRFGMTAGEARRASSHGSP